MEHVATLARSLNSAPLHPERATPSSQCALQPKQPVAECDDALPMPSKREACDCLPEPAWISGEGAGHSIRQAPEARLARLAMIETMSSKLPSCVVPSVQTIVRCATTAPAGRTGKRPTRSAVRSTCSGVRDAFDARKFLPSPPPRRSGAAQHIGVLRAGRHYVSIRSGCEVERPRESVESGCGPARPLDTRRRPVCTT
jgi:hypothetical protein